MTRKRVSVFVVLTLGLLGLGYAFHLQLMRDVQLNREELRANTEAIQRNNETIQRNNEMIQRQLERSSEAIETFSARKLKATPTPASRHAE